MINIFLVDDHAIVRTGIRRLLEDIRGMKVVGEAQSGEEAVRWCRKNEADVILMDMNMPGGMDGIEATRKITRYTPDAKIIILTVQTEEPFPTKVMQAGAVGYLSKGASEDEVVKAIRMVNSGQRYLAPEIAQQMALSHFTGGDNPFQQLSERELQIMMMITRGKKVSDISEQLNLSPKTVNSYRYRLFHKLGISGDVELTHLAIRHGMLDASKL